MSTQKGEERNRLEVHDGGVPPVSVVIPVYNEAEVIERVVRDFHAKVVSKMPGSELIVAEDGSTDGTKEILARLAAELPIRLVSGQERKGYTRAVKDALKLPQNDLVLFSDSDGQQEPDDFWPMLEKMKDYDLIVGYKHPRRDPLFRLILSRFFQVLNRLLFGVKFHDINCGFRLIRKKVIDDVLPEINLLPQFISSEFVLRAVAKGYRVCEMPVRHYPREFGGSRGLPVKRLPKEIWRLVVGLFRLRKEFKGKK